MKKSLSIIAGVFALLAVSCTAEKLETPAAGEEVAVSFTTSIPDGIATKVYSDGKTAKTLHYGVYVSGQNVTKFQSTEQFNENLEATVNLTLATGVSYDIIFWAQSDDAEAYSVDWAAKTMKVDYGKIKANDENNDAFYAYVSALKVDGAVNRTVELTRPFAQINLGTDDYDKAALAGLDVDRTNMVATLPSVLNFVDGTVGTDVVDAAFAVNTIGKTEKFPVDKYEYLEMNYILAGTQKSTVTIAFNVWETGMETSLTPNILVSNVPIQRNYRTNIYGSLLTDPANLKVVIQPVYTEPDYSVPADAAALVNAAKNGGSIALESDVTLDETLVVASGKELTINLNNHTLTAKGGADVIKTEAGAILNINGNGNVNAEDGTGAYAVWADGAETVVNIHGGVYTVGIDAAGLSNSAVYTKNGAKANIYGGTFQVVTEGTSTENAGGVTRYLINENDANRGTIQIYGGSFVGFNPADNIAEGANTNFVAEGYESVKREDAEIYDVKVKAGDAVVTITTAEELKTMLTTLTDSGSGNNKIIISANIELAEGEVWEPVVIQGYTGAGVITIEGNGHHISGLSAPLFKSGFAGNSGVKITDLTIRDSQMGHDATGYAGVFFGACDSMESLEFYNCHIENVTLSGSNYVAGFVAWIGGYNNPDDGPVVTDCVIEDCTVKNCNFTAGGSVGGLIGHAGGNPNTVIDITNCKIIGCMFNELDSTSKVGYAIGTVHEGQHTAVNKVTGDGNSWKFNGVDQGKLEKMVGRLVLNSTGHFYVDGNEVTEL